MMSELESSATITLRAALRKRRLSCAAARDIALPQVQRLKKSFMQTRFSSRKMGDLEAAVEKHRGVPVDKHQGYFCVSFVGRATLGSYEKYGTPLDLGSKVVCQSFFNHNKKQRGHKLLTYISVQKSFENRLLILASNCH